MDGDGEPYQVTVNFAEVKYIKHEEFVSVEERSPNYTPEDKKTSFAFDIGEKIAFAFGYLCPTPKRGIRQKYQFHLILQ